MAGKPGVFSNDSMRRISRAVQHYEGGSRDMPVVRLPRMGDGDDTRIRLGQTNSAWAIGGAPIAIAIWDAGTQTTPLVSTTGETVLAKNLLATIPSQTFVYLAEIEIDGELAWFVIGFAKTRQAIRLGKVGQQWTVGSTLVVPLWDAGTVDAPLVSTIGETVTAGNVLYTIKSGSWVYIAEVNSAYSTDFKFHVIAASDTYNAATIGGADLSIHPGYNGATNQALGHDGNGALKWFSFTTCTTP